MSFSGDVPATTSPLGVVVVSRDGMGKPETRPRVRTVLDQMRAAGGLAAPCSMVKDCLWINAEGSAILRIGSKQTIIGNVNEQSVKELRDLPVRKAVIRNHIEGNYGGDVCHLCEQWYSSYGKTIETDAYTAFMSSDTQYYRRNNELQIDW